MQNSNYFTLKNQNENVLGVLNSDERDLVTREPTKMLEVLSSYTVTLPLMAKLKEDQNHFNDMGFMQAIDIITAIEAVKVILKDNSFIIDDNKVIGYGHSHGAYLLHLCNRLAPILFSHIIDNSAWIKPVYLHSNRYLFQSYGSMTLQIEFDYIAKRIIEDKKALTLESFYKDFDNEAKIISFQGTKNNLNDHTIKGKLINKISNAEFLLIDEKEVDGHIFKSNRHGLGADFLKMFELGLSKLGKHVNENECKEKHCLVLYNSKITVDYSQGLPIFRLEKL